VCAGRPQRCQPPLHRLLARWFLEPPAGASQGAVARAASLVQKTSGQDGSLEQLRAAAAQLPGPLGRYHAVVSILGVRGTLWRCEVATAHTYLLFEARALPDIVIDVTFKQFLVMPEWMDVRHFNAAKGRSLFSELPDFFVGSHLALGEHMSLPALREAMVSVYEDVGDALGEAPFARVGEFERMHHLRNDVLFALHDAHLRRKICGRPAQ